MTVQLYGHQVVDLYAAATGAASRCTHIVVAVGPDGAIEADWHAQPRAAAKAFAARMNAAGGRLRYKVRPVRTVGQRIRRWLP